MDFLLVLLGGLVELRGDDCVVIEVLWMNWVYCKNRLLAQAHLDFTQSDFRVSCELGKERERATGRAKVLVQQLLLALSHHHHLSTRTTILAISKARAHRILLSKTSTSHSD